MSTNAAYVSRQLCFPSTGRQYTLVECTPGHVTKRLPGNGILNDRPHLLTVNNTSDHPLHLQLHLLFNFKECRIPNLLSLS